MLKKIVFALLIVAGINTTRAVADVAVSAPYIVTTQAMFTHGAGDNTLIDGQLIPLPGANHWLASVFDLDGAIVHILSKSRIATNTPYSDGVAWRKKTCYRINGFCRNAPAGSRGQYAFTEFAPGLIETGIKSLWFMDVYSPGGANGNELLAFVHEEREGNAHGDNRKTGGLNYGHEGFTRIGLAWSSDSGNTWRYLGKIIRPFADPVPFNIQGAPYIVKADADGHDYFYVYYKDDDGSNARYTNGIGVSRARVSDVINAARNHGNIGFKLWKKYHKSDWTQDAYGGVPSFPTPNFWGIIHTQALHSRFNNKYYMPLTSMSWNGGNTKVVLYESSDGLVWKEFRTLISERASSQGEKPAGYQYCSMVGKSGDANHQAGDTFYVDCMKYSQGNIGDTVKYFGLYRWEIDLDSQDSMVRYSQDYSEPSYPANWSYQYGFSGVFGNLGYNYGLGKYGSDVWIDKHAIKPYDYEEAAITWIAPADGTVDFRGTARDVNPSTNGKCAYTNGVIVKLLHNNIELVNHWINSGDSVGKSIKQQINVSKGDTFRIVFDALQDARCDETFFDPSIRYLSN